MRTPLPALALALALGCAARHGGDDLIVGRDSTPMAGGASDTNDDFAVAGTSSPPPTSTDRRGLDASIEDPEGVTLDVVTTGCAGTCFDVVAVARGGYPPYSYRWNDGSSEPTRTLCPDATRVFTVVATDRGYVSDEFTREPESVVADVTAEVLACPDAGAPDAGITDAATHPIPDAAVPEWEGLCIQNGSFEEPNGAPWTVCPSAGMAPGFTIAAGGANFAPAVLDGRFYLRVDLLPGQSVTLSQRLCKPVRQGIGYYWSSATALGLLSGPARIDMSIAKSDCAPDGHLASWEPTPEWAHVCSAWPALWDGEYLVITATTTGSDAVTVYLDAWLPNSAMCPVPTNSP